MRIFTNVGDESTPKFGSDEWKEQISNSIRLTGIVDSTIKVILANKKQILDSSSSIPRIKRGLIKKFQLILSQPDEIGHNNGQHVRCSICDRMIRWPAWYYLIRYTGNQFACFICWDDKHPNEPSTACYRRG